MSIHSKPRGVRHSSETNPTGSMRLQSTHGASTSPPRSPRSRAGGRSNSYMPRPDHRIVRCPKRAHLVHRPRRSGDSAPIGWFQCATAPSSLSGARDHWAVSPRNGRNQAVSRRRRRLECWRTSADSADSIHKSAGRADALCAPCQSAPVAYYAGGRVPSAESAFRRRGLRSITLPRTNKRSGPRYARRRLIHSARACLRPCRPALADTEPPG